MSFTKKVIKNELYLYDNGELIFKKWIDKGISVVFTPFPYGKNTLVSITDKSK